MIDKMVQDGIGAMLVQETWKEGNHNNVEIGDTGCYMFSHNREIGKGGKDHVSRRCHYTISKHARGMARRRIETTDNNGLEK